ncbi:MAG: PHP domain-containing protein [Syntrophales bacterium]|nr:PHP domain-containing protein [Syntrophales bacterium]
MEHIWSKSKIIEFSDIKGDLHVHTNWSDGAHYVEEMAYAAIDLGYEYIAITDHYRGKSGTRGLDENRLKKQIEEIKLLNERLHPFRILTGIEVDINFDGSLDLPDSIIDELNVVIAAIHSSFGQSGEQITMRILIALRNPYVNILGHPTCVCVNADYIKKIIDEAKKYGKSIEINSMPERRNDNDLLIYHARERGVMLSLATDSHQVEQLSLMYSGVGMARRNLCEKKHLLNCLPLENLLSLLKKHRQYFDH